MTQPTAPTPPRPHAPARKPVKALVQAVVKYVVPLAVTVALCWLMLTGMDLKQMWHTVVTQCRFGWIAGTLALAAFSNVIRGARWRMQLSALGVKAGLWELTLSFFGTYAVNLVFPRLGEFWRTGWIARRTGSPFATVFGSMVADRLTDTLSVGLLTLLALALSSSTIGPYLEQNMPSLDGLADTLLSPWALAGLAAVIALAVWAWTRYPESKLVKKTRTLLKGLWQGFAVLGRMPGLGRWLLLTLALWTCYWAQLYLAMYSFPLTAEAATMHGPVMVLVVFVLSSLSMGVPSNGGIGPWQWAVVLGLSMYSAGIPGLDREYATTFANLVMGCQTLLLIVLGIFTFICIALMKKRNV